MKRVFRLPATRARSQRDFEEELAFHLEGRIEELMEREGLSRADAEREARRRFGDVQAYRRETRAIDDTTFHRRHRMELLETIRREFHHASHALIRTPAFSLVSIVTLALGLGAATTIFTVLDRVVIRPLAYPNADRLVHLGTLWPKVKAGEEYMLSKGQYFFFKQNSRTLADIAMYDRDVHVVMSDGTHPAEHVPGVDVSASTFALFGIRPELGRLFATDAELYADGDPRVALISHAYWERRYGADPNVIGQRIQVDGEPSLEIIGVLPAGARLPDVDADIWVRNHLDPTAAPQNNHTHFAVGLLREGASVEAASAELRALQDRFQREHPNVYGPEFLARTGFAMNVTSLRDHVVGTTVIRTLWLIFAAVGFVLLIAAANVANLFFARIDARRREVAVRTALGADRAHLAAYYLTESVLLALVSAIVALAFSYALLRVVLSIAPQSLPRLDDVHVDGASAAFCFGAAMLFGVVFGLLPLGSAKVDVALLRDGARQATASRARAAARGALVVAQVALAVMLLSGAGLMVRSFANLRAVSPGIDPTGVQTMTIFLPRPYTDGAGAYDRAAAFWRTLTQRVQGVPGVQRAGATDLLPFNGGSGCSSVVVDVTSPTGERGNCMPMGMATPGFFEAMGIPLYGTPPTWDAVVAHQAPAVITAAFAKRFWGESSAIGHHVTPFNPQLPAARIVAVSGDVRANGLQNPPIEAAFFPIVPPPGARMWPNDGAMTLVLRAPSLSEGAAVRAVRSILAELEPRAVIADEASMQTLVDRSMAETSFTMMLLLIAAIIALALSAVGIYGVISYVVSQRRGEIGIRIALGARLGDVVRLVVGHSMKLAIVGAVLGTAGAFFGMRVLQSLLFGVSANDPLTLSLTVTALLAVAALAAAAPTRRAAKIDPVEAMR